MKNIFKLVIILSFLLFNISCASSSDINLPKIKCYEKKDCIENQICDAGYCVDNKILDTDVNFSLKIIPENYYNNNKFYYSKIINNLTFDDLNNYADNDLIELEVEDKVNLKGSIISSNINEFKILFISENNLKFFTKSFTGDRSNSFYNIKLPKNHLYEMYIEAKDSYPPMYIKDINLIDNYNFDVNIDEYFKENKEKYNKYRADILFNKNGATYKLKEFSAYAYYLDNGVEKVISNNFKTKDGKLEILIEKERYPFYLKIKSLDDNMKDIEVNKVFYSKDDLKKEKILIGNFYKLNDVNINIISSNKEFFKSELIITRKVNDTTSYKVKLNNGTMSENEKKSILDFKAKLFDGKYNIKVILPSNSKFSSLDYVIDVNPNSRKFSIQLKDRFELLGKLEGSDANLKFIKKDKDNFYPFTTSSKDGKFSIFLDSGIYDLIIEPKDKNYSNWVYSDILIDKNTYKEFRIPMASALKFHSYTNNNKPLKGSVVKLNLLKKENMNCNFSLPNKEILLYQTVSNKSGAFVLYVPIIRCNTNQ